MKIALALAACLFAAPPLAFAAPAAAQEAPAATAANAQATPPMWRVTDGDSEVWLLGTFHLLPKTLDWRPAYLTRAFDAADAVYFETDTASPQAQARIGEIIQKEGRAKPGEHLDDILDPIQYQAFAEQAKAFGLSPVALNGLRPWLATITLSVQFAVSKGFDPSYGVDTVLRAQAKDAGKRIGYLEEVGDQLGIFTSLSPEMEKDLLIVTLEELAQESEEFDALFAAWTHGDAHALDGFFNDQMRDEAPELYDALLTDRNQTWAEEIDAIMKGNGRTLIAVGAGHLVGPQGLPAMLRAKGYTVERYDASAQ